MQAMAVRVIAVVVCAAAFSYPSLLSAASEPAAPDSETRVLHGLQLQGHFAQGGLVFGQLAGRGGVYLQDRALRLTPEHRFIIGFGRDHPAQSVLRWRIGSDPDHEIVLNIKKRTYRTQRIDGLPRRMVTPDPSVLERIRRENAEIARVRAQDSARPWYQSGFIWPVIGRITGVFGSQRILNGKPRRPHYGIDIAAHAGTPVRAPADGRIAMAEADLYYTGGTVMIDHGHGLTSVYSHLKEVTAAVGSDIRQGDPIGTVGSTGRSTGPHLDWRINWFKERLDPALLVGPMPQPE